MKYNTNLSLLTRLCGGVGNINVLQRRSYYATRINSTGIDINDEITYHDISTTTLEHISDLLAVIEEMEGLDITAGSSGENSTTIEEAEVDMAQGVLTFRLLLTTGSDSNDCSAKYHWVINKQAPNRQLWWSSPISGPRRYEWKPPVVNDAVVVTVADDSLSAAVASIGCWHHTRSIDHAGHAQQEQKQELQQSQQDAGDDNLLSILRAEILQVTGVDLLAVR
mmetsp:Transcript_10639/g.17906  ORF Transcript_10639/g.17906 Transcript_10639/m.17906 type:complete len:223 (+) Transcript_10639:115-783(+)